MLVEKIKTYFLQETLLNRELESQSKIEWDTEVIFWHQSLSAHGFAILFNKGDDYAFTQALLTPWVV